MRNFRPSRILRPGEKRRTWRKAAARQTTAQSLSLQKTPGFSVSSEPLVSFGYRQLKDLVDAEVRAVYPGG